MYSTISSKIETVQGKRVEACILFAGSLRMRSANLQICHAAASATRVNQGVEPWVLQQPLASFCLESQKKRIKPGGMRFWVTYILHFDRAAFLQREPPHNSFQGAFSKASSTSWSSWPWRAR
jgi:hypothetical protein